MPDGFLFDELSELKKDLLRSIKDKFPDETKKYLKKQAGDLAKVARKIGKKQVGTSKDIRKNWNEKKSYHKKWKVGTPYQYAENDLCCRMYNSANHSHLIEYGHRNIPRSAKRATTREGRKNDTRKSTGFTQGKLILKQAEVEFLTQYIDNCEKFLSEYVTDTINGKV